MVEEEEGSAEEEEDVAGGEEEVGGEVEGMLLVRDGGRVSGGVGLIERVESAVRGLVVEVDDVL